MRDTEFNEIDGHKYACHMMPATLAQSTFIRLVELVGKPAIHMAVGAFRDDSNVEVADLANIGLITLFERLSPEESDEVIKAVLNGVDVEGKGAVLKVFDDHFRGSILHLYKVFHWSLAVNYRDFVDAATSSGVPNALSGILNQLKTAAKASATRAFSGPTSTPESGGSAAATAE